MTSKSVLVVGPFPPPVHGFSVATQSLANEIRAEANVKKVNLASTSEKKRVAKILNGALTLRAIWKLIGFKVSGGKQVSLGCNGGKGLIFTLSLLLSCRLLNLRTSVHHHSYAYINSRSPLMSLLVNLSNGSVVHVFLAKSMRDRFAEIYGHVPNTIIPNAYMVPVRDYKREENSCMVIGLLSNLTEDKGLGRFIDLCYKLKKEAVEFEARLAGPAGAREQSIISEALQDIPELSYAGPLYGELKDDFLRGLDLFVFPSNYCNEAQPIVIYEALASGVPVLAINKGCIAEQVQDCLQVFTSVESFDNDAAKLVADLAKAGLSELHNARNCARYRVIKDAEVSKSNLRHLIDGWTTN